MRGYKFPMPSTSMCGGGGGEEDLCMLDVSQTPAIGPEQPRKLQIRIPRKLHRTISNRSQVCRRRVGCRRAIRRGVANRTTRPSSFRCPSLKFQRSAEKHCAERASRLPKHLSSPSLQLCQPKPASRGEKRASYGSADSAHATLPLVRGVPATHWAGKKRASRDLSCQARPANHSPVARRLPLLTFGRFKHPGPAPRKPAKTSRCESLLEPPLVARPLLAAVPVQSITAQDLLHSGSPSLSLVFFLLVSLSAEYRIVSTLSLYRYLHPPVHSLSLDFHPEAAQLPPVLALWSSPAALAPLASTRLSSDPDPGPRQPPHRCPETQSTARPPQHQPPDCRLPA